MGDATYTNLSVMKNIVFRWYMKINYVYIN